MTIGSKKSLIVIAVASTLAGLVLLGAHGTQAQASDRLVWAQITGVFSPNTFLNDVFMTDANDAWVLGYVQTSQTEGIARVYKLEYRNDHWGVAYTQDFGGGQIVAESDNNVWVIAGNHLLHKNEHGWLEEHTPLSGVDGVHFETIQMFGNGEEGWIGGTQEFADRTRIQAGFLLHYMDGEWQQDPSFISPANTSLYRLHFVQGSGWAIGSGPGSDPIVWHSTGNGWLQEAVPPCTPHVNGCQSHLTAVQAVSGDEAWIVGAYEATYQPPFSQLALILHRANGAWEQVLPGAAIADDPFSTTRTGGTLWDASFARDSTGVAIGTQVISPGNGADSFVLPFALRLQSDGRWHYEITPPFPDETGANLNAISLADSTHALVVGNQGFILGYGYGGPTPTLPTPVPTMTPKPSATSLPTERVADPKLPGVLYFPVVGHTLRGGFRSYWEQHGGLSQFGYPLTEEYLERSTDGKSYTTQYFERARFEWHPENRPPYDVLLGLLGREVTSGRNGETPFLPASPAGQGSIYFPQTRHNLATQFVQYWQAHGGLPVYGYPISEPFQEVSPTNGKSYLVQYFERNRFEYHPELPDVYRVSLGLLGAQILQSRGWLPVSP